MKRNLVRCRDIWNVIKYIKWYKYQNNLSVLKNMSLIKKDICHH